MFKKQIQTHVIVLIIGNNVVTTLGWTASEVRCQRRNADRYTQRDGYKHLVAPARPTWQQLSRCAVLSGKIIEIRINDLTALLLY